MHAVTSLTLILALSSFASLPAVASENRDDEIFGGSNSEPQADSQGQSQGGVAPPVQATGPKEVAPTLPVGYTLGGKGELSLDLVRREHDPPSQTPLAPTQELELFFDSRDEVEDIRFFTKARLRNERSGTSGTLTEFWFRSNSGQVFYTFGQQPLKWGSSRIWNPTDFLAREIRDPFAVEDRRAGLWLLKFHIPFEKQGSNFYAVVDAEGASQLDDLGGALRSELLWGSSEIALTAAARPNSPLRLGADISAGVGPIDLHIESAFLYNDKRRIFSGEVSPRQGILPQERTNAEKWVTQVVAGVELTEKYSDEETVTVGGEYFYNGFGYDNLNLETWALLNGEGRPFYLGKQYAALYVQLPNPGPLNHTTFMGTMIGNLSDSSATARLTTLWNLGQRTSISCYLSQYLGERGEFRFAVPEALRVPPESLAFIQDEALRARIAEFQANEPTTTAIGLSAAMRF